MAERDSADHEDLLVRELLSNQEPQRLSPGSAGPEPALGMPQLCRSLPGSHAGHFPTLSHSFLLALSSFPPLLLLSAALRLWKQPSCLSLHGTSLCHPLHHRAQEGNKRLSQQPWRRRIRCAGMEQPVPVFQQRFNLPLAYKQQMFVQLTCKQATCIAAGPRRPAPRSATLGFLPSSRVTRGRGPGTSRSGMLGAPQARWLEPGSDARRGPTMPSCCCIPSAPLGSAACAELSQLTGVTHSQRG